MAFTSVYVRADAAGSGNGTTNTNSGVNGALTLAEAITHSATHTDIVYEMMNVGGTFAMTTTSITFNGNGTTTAPNKWRGNNTTIGDIEADVTNTLTKPKITFTSGIMTVSGTYQSFTGLDISGAPNGSALIAVTSAAANTKFFRVRVEHTGTGSNGNGAVNTANGQRQFFIECWFKAAAISSNVFNNATDLYAEKCVFTGGVQGMNMSSSNVLACNQCIFYGHSGTAFAIGGTGLMTALHCTFYNLGGDGIQFQSAGVMGIVSDSIFSDISGTGIKRITSNTDSVVRRRNAFWNVTTAQESGFGDSVPYLPITLAATPFINAPTDFRIIPTALVRNIEERFENQTFSGYCDIGAVGRQETSIGMM